MIQALQFELFIVRIESMRMIALIHQIRFSNKFPS